ncbi:MAG: hypothetical protein EZS28_033829, partial [Streblomastix strix]
MRIEEEQRLKRVDRMQRIEELTHDMVCSLTNELMQYPVYFNEDANSYERAAFAEFAFMFNISPMTMLPIENNWQWGRIGLQTNGNVSGGQVQNVYINLDTGIQEKINAQLQKFPHRVPRSWDRIQSSLDRPPIAHLISQQPVRQLRDYQHNVHNADNAGQQLQLNTVHTLPDHITLQRGRPQVDRFCPLNILALGDGLQQGQQLRGGWIRNIRIVKEKGRRPWSAIQQRQGGQVGQQERQYHRFDLIEAETCLQVAQEIMLGVQQPQFLTQIQNLGLNYPWQKKYYVYHVWDGDMGNNYAKLPQSVINGLREEIIKRKNDAQKKLDDYLYGRIAQDLPQEMNEPNSRYSIRLFGCHTLSEAQEKFRTEFFDSMDLQFPVQSGVSTEQDADDAFLRRNQRRIAAQGGGQQNAAVPDDPKDLFDELNDDERFDQKFFYRNQNILPGLEFAHTYGRGRYYASLPGVQLVITELAASITSNIRQHNNQIL